MAEFDPSKPSAAYRAMEAHWRTVRDVLAGAPAVRSAGQKYLPKLPREADADYTFRLAGSPFVNHYAELSSALVAKPFTNEVSVTADAPDQIKALVEDIDGQGNSLHVFAERAFFDGVHDGITFILVDKMPVPDGATVADEKAAGARPYWVNLLGLQVLGFRVATVEGRTQVIEARIAEEATVEDEDGTERLMQRVRVLRREKTPTGYAPATWVLWERQELVNRRGQFTWVPIEEGSIAIGVIPLVPMVCGRQLGARLAPVFGDLLSLQLEHYERESLLKNARMLTAFPMLSAAGVSPPTMARTITVDGQAVVEQVAVPITVGPGTVLYGAPLADGGSVSWSYVEPNAASLKFLADDIERLETQMRELGRQPLTKATSGVTVVAASFAAANANSTAEALALNLKDALEQAMAYTAMWLQIGDEPEIAMSTDFATDLIDGGDASTLLEMRKANDLSVTTLWAELRRRNVLSPEFDPDAELQAILGEIQGDDFETSLAALPKQEIPA